MLVSACPKAGCFRQPLNPSDSDYQVTSHSSSGESSATQLPPLKMVLGQAILIMIFAAHRLRTYAVFDFVILFRAKPRPSKKARLDKAAEEDAVLEPGKTPRS